MPKLITTIVKPTNETLWVLVHPDYVGEHFTQTEIETVIRPFRLFVQSLPGHNPASYQITINENIAVVSVEYATVQNAIDAAEALGERSTHDPVILKNALIRHKLEGLGVRYAVTFRIEADLPSVTQ